jgi:transposase-like protein
MSSGQTTSYSEAFKANAIKALLQPDSGGLAKTARKFNIAPSTLFGWKKKCANQSSMKNQKQPSKNATKCSPEEKLNAVIKTGSMSANEMGEFLRANGLHSNDLIIFKEEILTGVKTNQIGKGRPKIDPEITELRKSKKNLERSLKRTESALAEQSARIILLKKSHEIWGEPEDEE